MIRSILRWRAARRLARKRGLVLSGSLCVIMIISMTPVKAYSKSDIEAYKIYAHMKLLNTKEFRCLDDLWTKESNWNPTSKNKHSSAYGIPQILGLKEKNPYKQIDKGLSYILNRHLTPCLAWEYWKKEKHY